jgi:hypothetical protein
MAIIGQRIASVERELNTAPCDAAHASFGNAKLLPSSVTENMELIYIDNLLHQVLPSACIYKGEETSELTWFGLPMFK